MKKILTLFLLLASGLFSQDWLIGNAFNRPSTSLNGQWNYIIDPYENGFYNYRYQAFDQMTVPGTGAYYTNSKPQSKSDLIEYDFDLSPLIEVPGDWNTQEAHLLYYEGTAWYKKSFDYPIIENGNRLFVYFAAVNYRADVYLNGKKLGSHVGGFTPFNFEITGKVKEKDNFLVVRVDNKRQKEGVPTLNTDWWNYGGITRDVKLIETPATFIRNYLIQLNPEDPNRISGFIHLDGPSRGQRKVILEIPELDLREEIVTDPQGKGQWDIAVNKIIYWSVETPHLYEIRLRSGRDEITDRIGFRTIKTEGAKLLLNDELVFLRGVSIHEENPLRGGRANSREDANLLLSWARELGCNYVRLAHYPHNEYIIRQADELGLLVWSEIPVYWTIDWNNKETYKNAEGQLEEMITRDHNRAAVIIWSLANETPPIPARNLFLSALAEKARFLDGTRLISAALESKEVKDVPHLRTISDPFAEKIDVLSFNQYIGWYDGLPEKCERINWRIDIQKPVIVSEFGAGAKKGYHGDRKTRWTEEYQEYTYQAQLKMLGKIEQLCGISPWILADFRSPRRSLPGIQDGWNRKGLISDKGEKKKAFYLLQGYYNGFKKGAPVNE